MDEFSSGHAPGWDTRMDTHMDTQTRQTNADKDNTRRPKLTLGGNGCSVKTQENMSAGFRVQGQLRWPGRSKAGLEFFRNKSTYISDCLKAFNLASLSRPYGMVNQQHITS